MYTGYVYSKIVFSFYRDLEIENARNERNKICDLLGIPKPVLKVDQEIEHFEIFYFFYFAKKIINAFSQRQSKKNSQRNHKMHWIAIKVI